MRSSSCRRRRRPDDEAGFSLIELMVAMSVMLVALFTLVETGLVGLTGATIARDRQSASGLVNQALEQVRALPFDTIKRGLDNTDLASGGDTDITSTVDAGVTTYFFRGEPIPRGANATTAPIVPHATAVTVGPTPFTVRAYVTHLQGSLTSNTYRVTVRVSWTLGTAPTKVIEAQTVLYPGSTTFGGGSGSGCQQSTHPFAAPCQAFFAAEASAPPGLITLVREGAVGLHNASPDVVSAQIVSPGPTATMSIEQVSSVQGTSRTSGVALTLEGQAQQSLAQLQATSGADNDPSIPKPEYESVTTATQSNGELKPLAGEGYLKLKVETPSTASSISTTKANDVGRPCADPGGTGQNDAQPCAEGTSRQAGKVYAELKLKDGEDQGTGDLALIESVSGFSKSYLNRAISPELLVCTGTSGFGCVHAKQTRFIGKTKLADKLSGFSNPSGWSGYLVQLDNYEDATTAEGGIGALPPTLTRSGQLKYYNGSGYTTINMAAGAGVALPIPTLTILDGTWTLTMTPTIRTGSTTLTDPAAVADPVGCLQACTRASASAEIESPLLGEIVYTVLKGSTVKASFRIQVDLGLNRSRVTYFAPPAG